MFRVTVVDTLRNGHSSSPRRRWLLDSVMLAPVTRSQRETGRLLTTCLLHHLDTTSPSRRAKGSRTRMCRGVGPYCCAPNRVRQTLSSRMLQSWQHLQQHRRWLQIYFMYQHYVKWSSISHLVFCMWQICIWKILENIFNTARCGELVGVSSPGLLNSRTGVPLLQPSHWLLNSWCGSRHNTLQVLLARWSNIKYTLTNVFNEQILFTPHLAGSSATALLKKIK